MGRVDKAGKPEFRAREASEKRGAVWGGISDERRADVFNTCRVALLCTALYDALRSSRGDGERMPILRERRARECS